MGVAGTDGVFRKCSEETLRVMRQNKDSILSVVDVLLHDPLYRWVVSPTKAFGNLLRAKRRRCSKFNARKKKVLTLRFDEDVVALLTRKGVDVGGGDEGDGNIHAERVVLRIREKLHGRQLGEFLTVS